MNIFVIYEIGAEIPNAFYITYYMYLPFTVETHGGVSPLAE